MQGGGMRSKVGNIQSQNFYTLYYRLKAYRTVSPMVQLLSCKKPESGPLLHSRNVELTTPDLIRMVVWGINTNTDLFIPDFCIYSIYIYTTLYLSL